MLTVTTRRRAPAMQRGFSLIELMISMVIGSIVAIGAVSLIVAIDRSNSETIQATRIHQELRALASVIADEIKRSRRLHDAVAAIGQGATSNGTFDFVDTSTAGCIVYGYQDTPLSDGVANEDYTNYYDAVYRTTSNGIGTVNFAQLKKNPADMAGVGDPTSLALGCTDATNAGATTLATLTSPLLNVTALTFSCQTLVGTTMTPATSKSASCNQINMSITANLISGDATYTNKISYTYVQQVFIRSGAVKTS